MTFNEQIKILLSDTDKIILALKKKYPPNHAGNVKRSLDILTACIFSVITYHIEDSDQVAAANKIFAYIEKAIEERKLKKKLMRITNER